MNRVLKKIFAGIGMLIAGIIILVVSSILLLKTDYVQQTLLGLVNDRIPGAIFFEKLKFSLLKGEIELKNIRLIDPDRESLAQIDRIYLNMGWLRFFSGDLTVAALILENPGVKINVDKNGNLNFATAFVRPGMGKAGDTIEETNEEGAGFPLNPVIRVLKIINGTIDCEIASSDLKFHISRVDLDGGANLKKQTGNLEFNIVGADFFLSAINPSPVNLTVKSNFDSGMLDIVLIKAVTDSTEITLSGTISELLNQPVVDLNVELDADLADVKKCFQLTPGYSGRIHTTLKAAGKMENPDVTCGLTYGGGIVSDFNIEKTDMEIHLNNRLVELNLFLMKMASGDLSIKGEADLRDAFAKGFFSSDRDLNKISYDLDLELNDIKLDELLENASLLKGSARTELRISGQGVLLKDMSAGLFLKVIAENVAAGQAAKAIDLALNSEVAIKAGTLEIKTLGANIGNILVQASGLYNFFSHDISVILDLDAPDLSVPGEALGIGETFGSVSGQLSAAGDINQLKAHMNLNGKNVSLAGVQAGDILMDIRLQNGIVHVDEARLQNRKSVLAVNGHAALFEPGQMALKNNPEFQLEIDGESIDLENFVSRMNNELKGRFDIDAALSGSLKSPTGNIHINGRDIDLGVQKISEVNLVSEIKEGKIWLNPLQIAVDQEEIIEATGWVSLDKTYEIAITSPGISLNMIDGISESEIDVQGKISLNISGKGGFDNPEIHGDIEARELHMIGKPFPDVQIHVELENYLAKISGNSGFNIEGFFDLKKKAFSAAVVFKDTDLAPCLNLAGHEDLNGTLTGKIEAAGNISAIQNIQGAVDIQYLKIFLQEKELIFGENIQATLKNKHMSFSGARLSLFNTGFLEINGNADLNGEMAIGIKGDIPLDVIQAFVDEPADIHGAVEFSAGVSGSASAPAIQGDILFKSVECTLPNSSQQLKGLNGHVAVSPEKIEIKTIDGKIDRGSFHISGEMSMDHFRPTKINVALNTTVLPIQIPEMMDMMVNSEIKVVGNAKKSLIQGDIVILDGMYYKDVELSLIKLVGQRRREIAFSAEKSELPEFLSNMGLDISIKRRNPFFVENNMAEMEIHPDLRITGDMQQPVISGRAEVMSGEIYFQKKIFEIKKGVIDFINPYKNEPSIEIISETQIREWLITLEISGTPDQLQIIVTSEPNLEDSDILSLLAVGKTYEELIKGESASNMSTTQMLAEFAVSTFGDDIKKSTGLDILAMETIAPEDSELSDTIKVTIGKELSRRMTMKYAVESDGSDIVQKAIAEYKLFEHILAEGFQGSDGSHGGELLFRLEFR